MHLLDKNLCLLNMASLRIGHFSPRHNGRSVKLNSPSNCYIPIYSVHWYYRQFLVTMSKARCSLWSMDKIISVPESGRHPFTQSVREILEWYLRIGHDRLLLHFTESSFIILFHLRICRKII